MKEAGFIDVEEGDGSLECVTCGHLADQNPVVFEVYGLGFRVYGFIGCRGGWCSKKEMVFNRFDRVLGFAAL